MYYKGCTFLKCFASRFLNRTFNECIAEFGVSSFEDDENAEKLNLIFSYEPQPLYCMSVVEAMLINHFGKKFTFHRK